MLCNNNEIYGLTGGQTGPTTPQGTKTVSSPGGRDATARSTCRAWSTRTRTRTTPRRTVYHQGPDARAIKEAIEWPGFAFVDITSQCIENNGRRIGFPSANEMLNYYKKEYRQAPPGSTQLANHQLGIVKAAVPRRARPGRAPDPPGRGAARH